MAQPKTANLTRSGAGVLRPLADPELWPPASRLEGRKLTPVQFSPESGRPVESDGAPLSKFGWKFRDVFAKAHKIDPDDVDLGLVRAVEALNADSDRNIAALSIPHRKRTEHGVLTQVNLVVNTPLVLPWFLNGRALRRMGLTLHGQSRLVTSAVDHPTFALPTMYVDGPDAVLNIVSAQRHLLGFDSYSSAGKKKDLIDKIVQFGVLDPPDVVLTKLISPTGSAWVSQAAEGAQRLFSSLLAMDQLAGSNVGGVATEAWYRTPEPALRDLSPDDLRRLEAALQFSSSKAAGYFPGPNIPQWLEETGTNPAAVSFQLLRTMEIALIIAVDPDEIVTRDEKNPVSSTVQELIRSYHVPGKAKDAWQKADVQGMVAIGVIDELTESHVVTEEERSSWLGESLLPWNGDGITAAGVPGNRLVSVTKLLGTLTVRDTTVFAPDTIGVVDRHLLANGMQRKHADDRANVAAAQAVVALGIHGTGTEGTLQAALFGAFHASWFWNPKDQASSECWLSLIGLPLGELAARANLERLENVDSSEAAGPAQRALAALGGVALMANPGLLKTGDALTRTGRGGGGKVANVRASDPNVLLAKMVQDERGITQLRDAVAALTVNAQTTIPVDRETQHPLEDLWLRNLWLDDNGDDGPIDGNPVTMFSDRILKLIESLEADVAEADRLKTVTPNQLVSVDAEDDEEPLYEAIGISEEYVRRALPHLQHLNEFLTEGMANARAARRAQR